MPVIICPEVGLLNTHPELSCSRKELTIFMEAARHDTVGGIKRFLHTITMMYINIDVQHPLMISVHDPKTEKDEYAE